MEQMEITKKKVLIACPTEGLIPSAAYDSHMEFMFHVGKIEAGSDYKFHFGTVGGVFTPLARERICDEAVKSGMDYVFMFDDDMTIPVDCLERLLAHDVDVVAPLAFMKRPPHAPVIFSQRSGFEGGKPWFSTTTVKNYPKDTLYECDAVGFGGVLIKTEVIKKMTKPYFMSTCGTGEDILFCFNAKNQTGAKIFVDTSVKLGHLAARTKIIDEQVFEEHNNIQELRETVGDYSQAKKESNLVA